MSDDERDREGGAGHERDEADAPERWDREPANWSDELAADLDALAEALDALEAGLDGLADEATPTPNPSARWAEARLRSAALALFVADARTELEDLRDWAERGGDDPGGRVDDLESRIDDLGERVAAVNERVDELGTTDWQDAHAESIVAFDAFLGEREPPVDWADVRAELEDHLQALVGGS